MALFSLIYTSRKTSECNDSEIEKILKSCEKNNPSKDITGVLLHSENNFIQYLEGDYKKITELYDLIKADERHKNVALISLGPIKERSFPSWHMGYKNVSGTDIGFHTEISSEEKSIFQAMIKGEKLENISKSFGVLVKFFELT